MKTRLLLPLGLMVLLSIAAPAPAQNIVGYVNRVFLPGENLFGNPLIQPTNTLNFLIPLAPDGTTVSLWNSLTLAYDTTSVFSGGSWSVNLTLAPGTGARLTTSLGFTNTFVGTVLNHDGSLFTGNFTPPPPFAGPDGLYLFSDKAPVNASGTNLFLNIIGRLPNVGEQVIWLDEPTQTYHTGTYLGGGLWDNEPALFVSDAAFFNLGPVVVPEPTALALLALGGLLLARRRRGKVGIHESISK
ncbi:MAG: PEP-CTERM sorting domain-containing protein [Limisphaerales bacterium]